MWTDAELREIRAFLTLAEELHFARTAEHLGLTNPRVSQLIRGLETRIGGRLFDRTSRRVRLTPIGEQLLRELAPAYQQLQEALARAHEAATGVAGTVRLGSYVRVNAGPHIGAIIRTFTTRHPECDVSFVDTGIDRNYVELLHRGEVDVLAARLPLTAPGVTVGPVLSREERVLMVAEDDTLAGRESVSYEDIADRVVSDSPAFPKELMDAFVPPVTPSGKVLKRRISTSVEELLMRVALGVQVHPTVRSFADYLSHPGVTSVPIRDLPPSETALAWLTANRSRTIEAFVRAAGDVLARAELTRQTAPARARNAASG